MMVSLLSRRIRYPHHGYVHLVFTGDWHIGHKSVDYQHLERVLQAIREYDAYWVFMGDAGNAIIPKDARFSFDELDWERGLVTAEEQYKVFKDYVKPIRKNCIVVLEGNHDEVLRRKTTLETLSHVCGELKVPFGGFSSHIRIKFIRQSNPRNHHKLDLFLHHGYFSGRTLGGRINRLESMRDIFEADLYAMGHVHQLGYTATTTLYRVHSPKGGDEVKERTRLYLLTGGFIRGWVPNQTSYIERRMLKPTRVGALLLKIKPDLLPSVDAFEVKEI